METNEKENKNDESRAPAIKKASYTHLFLSAKMSFFSLENTIRTTGQQTVSSKYCQIARRICQKRTYYNYPH